MGWHYGEWGGLWMLLWMAVFWGGLLWLIFWGVRRTAPSAEPRRGAIDILEERYARGEIDDQALQARRAQLERT